MPEAAAPVLDIERVLFLDARNRKFVEKTSRITARARDARDSAWQVVMVLAIVGAIVGLAFSTHTLDRTLATNGKVTTGVITKKVQTHRPHICRITYQFNGPPLYERDTHIDYNLCPSMAVGQKVEVLYDPQQPLYARLNSPIETQRYPLFPAVIVFLAVLGTIPWQMSKVRRERRMCTEGQLICGSLIGKDIESDQLTMRYRFRHPSGYTIQSDAKGKVRNSSWTSDWQFFPDKPNQVAVLFLNEYEFYVL